MIILPFDWIQSITSFLINQLAVLMNAVVLPMFDLVFELLHGLVYRALYDLFTLVMRLMDIVQTVVGCFSGAEKVNYYGEQDYLINVVFFRSGVSAVIWGVTLIGLILAVVSSIAALSVSMTGGKRNIGKVVGSIGRTMLALLLIPCLVIVSLNLGCVLLDGGRQMVAGASENQVGISAALFSIVTLGADKDGNADDNLRYAYMTGQKNYYDPTQVSRDFDFQNMQFELAFLFTLYFLVIYLMACVNFIARMFQLLVLYITAPIFAASIPWDEGRKFKSWREAFFAKLLSGYGLVLGMEIYSLVVVPTICNPNIAFYRSDFFDGLARTGIMQSPDFIIKTLFLAAGAYAVYKCQGLLMQVFSPRHAHGEGSFGEIIKVAIITAIGLAVGNPALGKMAMLSKAKKAGQLANQAMSSVKNETDKAAKS